MNISINITASPELMGVLQSLTAALNVGKPTQVEMTATTPISIPPAPIQTQVQAQVQTPTSTPAPVAQTPVQAPMQQQEPAPMQTPTQVPAHTSTVPTTVQTYTMEQLAVAATQLVDAGRREELVQLLGQFGVQALTTLPKEQYGNFATQLRAMGAKI